MPRKSKSASLKKKSSRRTTKSSSILHNKMMLHLSLIIFIFNVVAFMFYQDMQSLFLFVVVLCMTYLFDQNMIIVLLTPSLIVGMLIVLRKTFMNNNVVEGFKESHNVETSTPQESSSNEEDTNDDAEGDDENEDSEETEDTSTQATAPESSSNESSENNSEGESNEATTSDETATESYANLKNSSIKNELSNLVSNYEKAQGMMKTLEKSKLDPQSVETQREIIKQITILHQ